MENRPGSQPAEIRATWPEALAAASTAAKCSGMRAWVSKESTVLNRVAAAGVCSIRSVAEPPQFRQTSTLSAQAAMSSTWATGAPWVVTVAGSRRVKTTATSMSAFLVMACSTPRPRLPYPLIATLSMVPPSGFSLQG